MTDEEMQRSLNHRSERGGTEEALKALADILGIRFPKIEKEKMNEQIKDTRGGWPFHRSPFICSIYKPSNTGDAHKSLSHRSIPAPPQTSSEAWK